ncbi:MAG TPA: ATP-binding SpoIIE family protein phosphatase [Terracidiphilus sp.]|jgi:anti-sigma regulatory factor (Ser/Thr protein kinase)
MEVALTEFVCVTDASSVGEVRRAAMTLGHRLGMDQTRSGELSLLATEVSRNVLVHGGGGQVILSGVRDGDGPLARILAMDQGPGIADVTRAMSDGYSTAGTMGAGLGAMKRMATEFEIFTGNKGTIVMVGVGRAEPESDLKIAGMAVPYPGERVCGDGWFCHREKDRTVVLLTDGLGHGWGAAEAAQESIATFQKNVHLPPAALLGAIHDALRKTRGAVGAVVEIRPKERRLTYSGVGNISAVLVNGEASKNMVSHNGTLGATVSRMQEFQFEWMPGAMVVLHSDGVQTRWDLGSYAGLVARHPAVIGGALLRDFRRQRDDASVIVIKAA